MSVRVVDVEKATDSLAEYAQQVDTGPIVLTRAGRAVAVVLAIKNADLETISLSTNADFMALIERSRARQECEGGISGEEIRRRVLAE